MQSKSSNDRFLLLSRPGRPSAPSSGASLESKAMPPAAVGTSAGVSKVLMRRSAARTRRRASRARPSKRKTPSLPPRLELVTTYDVVRRYAVANASSVAITRRTLGACGGCICTVANTTMTCVISSFRLRSVTIWPAAGSSVLWDVPSITTGAEQALSKESAKNSDLPTGITVDQPVVWRPKPLTYQGMWQNIADNPSDQFFAFSGASGAVIDVHMTVTAVGAVSAPFTITTSSTIALGTHAVGGLDTGGTPKITPIGYNSFSY